MSKLRVFCSYTDFPEAVDLLVRRGLEVVTWNTTTIRRESGSAPRTREEFLRLIRGVHGIFCLSRDKLDREAIGAAGPELKVIATDSVGYNHIDVATAKERGIRVGHTPNLVTDATAELTVGLLVGTARRLFQGSEALRVGNWDCGPDFRGARVLKGSTVGIYGLGRIGQAVMARLVPFGVAKFLYNGRTAKPEVTGAEFVSFDRLLCDSDFLIVTAALTAETKDVFDGAAFAKMKPDSVFINTSRGGLVQQDALVDALKTGKIGAAGLDVMTPEPLPVDHELIKLKNCVLTPHMGTDVAEVERDMAIMTAQNIIAALFDEEMPAEVKL